MRKALEKLWIIGSILLISIPIIEIKYAITNPEMTILQILLANNCAVLLIIASGLVCYWIAYMSEKFSKKNG